MLQNVYQRSQCCILFHHYAGDAVGGAATPNMLRPTFAPGASVQMDLYVSERPGYYGQHILHAPSIELGPSTQSLQYSVDLSADTFAPV